MSYVIASSFLKNVGTRSTTTTTTTTAKPRPLKAPPGPLTHGTSPNVRFFFPVHPPFPKSFSMPHTAALTTMQLKLQLPQRHDQPRNVQRHLGQWPNRGLRFGTCQEDTSTNKKQMTWQRTGQFQSINVRIHLAFFNATPRVWFGTCWLCCMLLFRSQIHP